MDAGLLTQIILEAERSVIVQYLLDRGFTVSGAERATRAYIDTKVFVAKETGEPQLGRAGSLGMEMVSGNR